MLMATVAMVGIVSVSAMNMIGGPITTAAKVTHQNMAQNDLLMNAKVVVMNASTRPQMGDEDSDGYIEPVPFVPVSDPACGITLPTGGEGGCLPADIGAILTDPWGTSYAYCVWDHGDLRSSVNRIDGEDSTSGAVMAIISAGPNKRFETPCLPYDGDPETNDIAINPQGEGDDLVQIYTYAAAVAGSGGLWELKDGEPTTATIAKDIEVEGAFRMGTAGEDPGQVGTSACTQGNHIGRMRFNPFDQAIEVCGYEGGSYEWETLAVAGGSVPVGTISAFAGSTCPSNWQAVTELQGRMIMGAGSGYAVGQTGGAATVALTEAQLPSHAHVVDPPNAATSASGDHAHGIGTNNNTKAGSAGVRGGDTGAMWLNNYTQPAGNHAHTVDIGAFWSHATGGNQAHENRPPYRVYLYCIYMGGGDGAVAKSFNDLEDVDTSGAQDNDILVWNESAGQWLPEGQWVKDGTKLFYEGGNVGIGTVSPQANLHVADGRFEVTYHGGWSQVGAIAYSATPAHSGVLNLRRARGTLNSPTYAKNGDILGHIVMRDHVNVVGSAILAIATEDHSGTVAGSNLSFRTTANGGLAENERMRITEDGNVGIRTTSPKQEFHVINGNEAGGGDQTVAQFGTGAGSLFLTHTGAHVSGNLRYDDGQWRYEGDGAGAAIAFGTDGRIHLQTADIGTAGSPASSLGSKMVVTKEGHIGIGTDNPLSPLEVVFDNRTGGITNDVIIRRPENTNDWSPITFVRSRGTLHNPLPVQNGDALGGLLDHVVLNGTDRNGTAVSSISGIYTGDGTSLLSEMRITTSGRLGVLVTDTRTPSRVIIPSGSGDTWLADWPASWGGGIATWDILGSSTYFSSYVTRSDRRYKDGIEAIENKTALDNLMRLQPVSYHYKEGYGTKGRHYGFIAQDVRDIMPDLVTIADTPDQRLGLEYQGLIAPMIAAIQALKTENDALRAELQAANDNFRRELDELKSAIGD